MQIIKASSESQREQSRLLINEAMPRGQLILKNNIELIAVEDREKELSNNRELFILEDNNLVMGTVVLQLTENEGYVLYLTRHPEVSKGFGKTLLETAENQAIAYGKQNIRLSIVYHPECTQQKLEKWYCDQGYQFLCEIQPDAKQKKVWKPCFEEKTVFKYFTKSLKK